MRGINRMTSGNSAFANQAAAQEIVQAGKMAALLDNSTSAPIQKNDTIDKLAATNQQQAKIITNPAEAIAKLKDGSSPTEQRAGRERPPHWAATKPKWDVTGYCWMHGFRVKVGHSRPLSQANHPTLCLLGVHALERKKWYRFLIIENYKT
jgi:hypothetical protein